MFNRIILICAFLFLLPCISIAQQDTPAAESLRSAVQSGDIDLVKNLYIKRDPNIVRTTKGVLQVAIASPQPSKDLIQLLIANGADVNERSSWGKTLLMWTSKKQAWSYDLTQMLIDAGANVNEADNEGVTVLMHTVEPSPNSGDLLPIIKLLLSKGADLRAKDKKGRTTLMHAKWDLDVIRFLMSKGSTLTAKASDGSNVLFEMIDKNPQSLEAVKFAVSKGVAVNCKNADGYTPLLVAIDKGNADVVKFLISKGADVKAATNDGRTVLHEMMKCSNIEIPAVPDNWKRLFPDKPVPKARITHDNGELTEFLIAKGADINARTKDGETPLHQAARSSDLTVAKVLVAKGADVNAKTNEGKTPLDLCDATNPEFVSFLLKNGANANTEKYDALALTVVDEQVLRELIKKGVNPGATDKMGRNILHYLVQTFPLSRYMIESEIKGKPSPGEGCKKVVDLLVANGAAVNAKDKLGCTPLHYAAGLTGSSILMTDGGERDVTDGTVLGMTAFAGISHHYVAQALLDAGADVTIKDRNGCTPLHYAGDIDLIKQMLEKGADINAKDTEGRTPLFYWLADGLMSGIMYRSQEVVKDYTTSLDKIRDFQDLGQIYMKPVIALAVAKGADLNTKDNKGRTLLKYLRENKSDSSKVEELLKPFGAKE